jgi:hypothetical protein
MFFAVAVEPSAGDVGKLVVSRDGRDVVLGRSVEDGVHFVDEEVFVEGCGNGGGEGAADVTRGESLVLVLMCVERLVGDGARDPHDDVPCDGGEGVPHAGLVGLVVWDAWQEGESSVGLVSAEARGEVEVAHEVECGAGAAAWVCKLVLRVVLLIRFERVVSPRRMEARIVIWRPWAEVEHGIVDVLVWHWVEVVRGRGEVKI